MYSEAASNATIGKREIREKETAQTRRQGGKETRRQGDKEQKRPD
jgi:hypothetical protein